MQFLHYDRRCMWIRGLKAYKDTDHQNYHRIALAYASDMMLSGMVLNLYPKFKVGLVTSLDHSMWFHVPVDSEKWYLHDCELRDSMDGRTLNSSRYVCHTASRYPLILTHIDL